MIRAGIFQIDEVLPFVVLQPPEHGEDKLRERPQRIYNGKTVHMDSLRYQTFIISGTVCVGCGLEAEYFALEQQPGNGPENRFHLNLYGLDEMREILFTKDHIVPRKHGGPNALWNLQTMCQPCNTRKGCDDETTLTYKRSRSRIKSLIWKVNDELRRNKQERKQFYQSGTSDGGPVFMAYKNRVAVLKKRAKLLRKIEAQILSERTQLKKKERAEFQAQLKELRQQHEQRRHNLETGTISG